MRNPIASKRFFAYLKGHNPDILVAPEWMDNEELKFFYLGRSDASKEIFLNEKEFHNKYERKL